jgi:hypothetical protein
MSLPKEMRLLILYCTLLAPTLERQRQAECKGLPGLPSEFQDSQGGTKKSCLKKEKKEKTCPKKSVIAHTHNPSTQMLNQEDCQEYPASLGCIAGFCLKHTFLPQKNMKGK